MARLGPPNTEAETGIGGMYLIREGILGNTGRGVGSGNWKGRKTQNGCIKELVTTVGSWGSGPSGVSFSIARTSLEHVALRSGQAGLFIRWLSFLIGWVCPGVIEPTVLFWASLGTG